MRAHGVREPGRLRARKPTGQGDRRVSESAVLPSTKKSTSSGPRINFFSAGIERCVVHPCAKRTLQSGRRLMSDSKGWLMCVARTYAEPPPITRAACAFGPITAMEVNSIVP